MGLLTLEPIFVTEKSKGKNTETEGEARKSFRLILILTVQFLVQGDSVSSCFKKTEIHFSRLF